LKPVDEAAPVDPAATLIVTRPQPGASQLRDALRARGRRAIAYPVLAIEPVIDDAPLKHAMRHVDDYRLVVFVSPNAIRHALAHRDAPWPEDVTIGVMGPGSRAALAALGIATARVVSPAERPSNDAGERFDSESLFDALDAALGLTKDFQHRALILRGNGGRAWFADRLRSLGIAVDEVEAYRRVRPEPDEASHLALRRLFEAREPVSLIVTCSEGIANIDAMVVQSLATVASRSEAEAWLHAATIVAPHRRIAEKARQAGFSRVTLCGPGDDGILAAIE
jgi:uroporphyrinogen III methyltransferase/synthase